MPQAFKICTPDSVFKHWITVENNAVAVPCTIMMDESSGSERGHGVQQEC